MKPIIIANWKMRLGNLDSERLASALRNVRSDVELVLCPSFVSLAPVAKILRGSPVALGAQDLFWEASGAYTGEVSGLQLREVGCTFVIVGHSERRQYLGETDDAVHRKVQAALSAGLTPIVCVGETFEQRQQGSQDYVLINQVTKALEGVTLGVSRHLIVAYEPVWVVGTGQSIDPSQANAAHQLIHQTLIDLFPAEIVRQHIRIIYGGSVDSSNVTDFTRLENTAGVLVGTASVNLEEFSQLVRNASLT